MLDELNCQPDLRALRSSVKPRKKWTVRYKAEEETNEDRKALASISREIHVPELIAKVLYNRGCHTAKEAADFIQLGNEIIHSPLLLKDCDKAVERILQAISKKEKIAIYGDYDVDGVTSVSMLYLYLTRLGAEVGYYIPSRTKDGYGVTKQAIEMLAKEKNVQFIITVDTGITAVEEVAYAGELGVDMVITDHHECHQTIPNAIAVVNPHREDCPYPFKELAGVGVVFKVICAVEMQLAQIDGRTTLQAVDKISREFADLFTLGTIADVMPIIDENRVLVSYGLRRIADAERLGVKALVDAAIGNAGGSVGIGVGGRLRTADGGYLTEEEMRDLRRRRVNSGFIGFGLAPRINAAGRMSTASIAVELLLADTEERAKAIAAELCDINVARQSEENRVAEEAYDIIENGDVVHLETDRVIVLDSDHWPQGIIGIVSSRITEKYGLPSILISFEGNVGDEVTAEDVGKGSGRSVKGMNLVDALRACEPLLTRFGGHELAAGMSIPRGNLTAFRRKINEYAKLHLDESAIGQELSADCVIDVSDVNIENAEALDILEPFGVANPSPRFIGYDFSVVRVIPLAGGKHTKLLFAGESPGREVCALYFNQTAASLGVNPGDRVDVFCQISVNEYRGERTAQLILDDLRPSSAVKDLMEAAALRYEAICKGAPITEEADTVIPTREDFVAVYTYLRKQSAGGIHTYHDTSLMSGLKTSARVDISFIKLKFIIRILDELQLCGVSEPSPGYYVFDVFPAPEKTSIENSAILRDLRKQCR